QMTVPDGESIRVALDETLGRADIVLITGGLGPTTDDITREMVAELFGLQLEYDEEIWKQIEDRFARRNLRMSPRNRQQALRPPESTVLWNPHGTAPGLYLPPVPVPNREPSLQSPHLFILPGPPRELIPMVEDYVVPMLRKILPPSAIAEMRVFRTAGVGESHVEELVGEELLALNIELGYCARPGEVDIRVIGTPQQIEQATAIIEKHLGKHLVSDDQRSLEQVIVETLTARGKTLAIAESCTGGMIANRVTNVPGSSAVFVEGFVTYANEAKTRSLHVPAELIAEHGAVSEPVAGAMAEGARAASGADYAIATTGIAGPGGGSEAKPVGTVYVGFASAAGPTRVEKLFFPTDRVRFKELVSQMALDFVRRGAGAEQRSDQ
ncbi:MAG TPA: nicotinamide-nucleotide amidohydrolase family protein, partial [Chthoniobacteraceae bacterium]|nr:nicotinamide-nucleotide amidohydrolase family protein [Chthoniobacteraceae bacterium]